MDPQYEKFRTTAQAALKLDIALAEAFRPDLSGEAEQAYGAYLRQRIRPAVEQAVLREDVQLLEALARKGWMEGLSLDDFLRLAGDRGKREAFVWLLRRKQEKFGFHRPGYSL